MNLAGNLEKWYVLNRSTPRILVTSFRYSIIRSQPPTRRCSSFSTTYDYSRSRQPILDQPLAKQRPTSSPLLISITYYLRINRVWKLGNVVSAPSIYSTNPRNRFPIQYHPLSLLKGDCSTFRIQHDYSRPHQLVLDRPLAKKTSNLSPLLMMASTSSPVACNNIFPSRFSAGSSEQLANAVARTHRLPCIDLYQASYKLHHGLSKSIEG
jgi:hypothetical protein